VNRLQEATIHADAADRPQGPTKDDTTGRDRWYFKDIANLQDALERYHHAPKSRLHGPGAGGESANGQILETNDRLPTYGEANRAIDRAMLRLAVWDPAMYRLLDHYYREGLWEKRRGWLKATARAGLIRNRIPLIPRAAFDWMLKRAILGLFVVHRSLPRSCRSGY